MHCAELYTWYEVPGMTFRPGRFEAKHEEKRTM